MIAWLKEHRAELALLFTWALVSGISLHFHEPWRDEADPWLYARDQAWEAFVAGGAYAGTPVLWFLFQAPFARAGFTYESLATLHWLIAAAGTSLLVLRARLPLLARGAFALSFFAAFEYAVVSRSYALALLCVWISCATWRSRLDRPWHALALAVLAQTNVPGLFFAAAIGVVGIARERPRRVGAWMAAVAAALSGMFTLWQLRPPEDGQKEDVAFDLALSDGAGWAVSHGFFPWGPPAVRTVLAGMLLATVLMSLRRDRVGLAVYLWMALPFSFLFTSVHQGHLRHFGFLLVALVVAAWISAEERARVDAAEAETPRTFGVLGKGLTPALAIVLVFTPWVAFEVAALKHEVTERFSNAEAMAHYIKKRKLEHRMFALSEAAVSVAPWLPKGRIYYPGLERFGSFLPWNAAQVQARVLSVATLARRTRAKFSHYRAGVQPLLLVTTALVEPWRHGYKLLHAEADEVWSSHGESLYLYAPEPVEPARGASAKRR